MPFYGLILERFLPMATDALIENELTLKDEYLNQYFTDDLQVNVNVTLNRLSNEGGIEQWNNKLTSKTTTVF